MTHILYDTISDGYAAARREDPRIALHIHRALGDAERIVNIGAGTGNYEPRDRDVVAVEPSAAMIALRRPGAAPVIRGFAEALPLRSGSLDAAVTVLTVHHWVDLDAGLREMARVADRQVIFLFDNAFTARFWAIQYFPEARDVASERAAPDAARIAEVLDVVEERPVPVPFDCIDGFGAAYWGRPEAYLDPAVHAGMSWLSQLPRDVLARGVRRLATDLASGEWDDRYGHLRHETERDVGYRLVLATAR